MEKILENQKKYYPFLEQTKEKIKSLVTFRIPYYVGPLTQKNAATNAKGVTRFAWSVRKEGKEHTSIKPWNWEEIIDKDASAEAFIRRMTGICSYLYGEDVLPKSSLLYQKFCLLNELNGARMIEADGDTSHRFDITTRNEIIEHLFKTRGKVSYKQVSDFLSREYGRTGVSVRGGQGETGFESQLSSYRFFHQLLEVSGDFSKEQENLVEEIILWSTLFEDRSILKDRLKAEAFQSKICAVFGFELTDKQIQAICKKRLTGWGRLSKKLLCGLTTEDEPRLSIIDVMEQGDGISGSPLIFQEIITHVVYGFQAQIDKLNKAFLGVDDHPLDNIATSPANKRTIRQAIKIVDEIVSITKQAPKCIYIETTREDTVAKKGKRTQTRTAKLEEFLKKLKETEDTQAVLRELKDKGDNLSERLMLYFLQNGKCLYSGKPLDINNLFQYQVDHIIPQAYIKDDSIDNKALVLSSENQRKKDSLLLDSSIRRKQAIWWKNLHNAGCLSDKKYKNLCCGKISDRKMQGFINRQLVETAQICKLTALLLKEKYPETAIIPVKAGVSSGIRKAWELAKCRDMNDFHHAHDAYLACEVGRFLRIKYPDIYENPVRYAEIVKQYVANIERKAFGSAPYASRSRLGSNDWFVHHFISCRDDAWNADDERERIEAYMNMPSCYVTHMMKIDTGEFWDQTLYSPLSGKKKLIPIKKNMPATTYGGYDSIQYACFFLYEGKNKDIRLGGLPICELYRAHLIDDIAQDIPALIDIEKRQLSEQGEVCTNILRPIVYKYQIIELFDGKRLFIKGKTDVANTQQLAWKLDELRVIKKIESAQAQGEDASAYDTELNCIFDMFINKTKHIAPYIYKALLGLYKNEDGDYSDLEKHFFQASVTDKKDELVNLCKVANASMSACGLTFIKKTNGFGRLRKTLSEKSLTVIDQSVTGMFEKKTHYGI